MSGFTKGHLSSSTWSRCTTLAGFTDSLGGCRKFHRCTPPTLSCMGSIEGFGPRKRIGRSSMKHICLIGITGMFPASTNYHSTTPQDGWSTYNGCSGVQGLISWPRTPTSLQMRAEDDIADAFDEVQRVETQLMRAPLNRYVAQQLSNYSEEASRQLFWTRDDKSNPLRSFVKRMKKGCKKLA